MNDILSYEELSRIYNKYFAIKYLGEDINTKLGLISLICYVVSKLREKHPNATYYQVISKLSDGLIPDSLARSLSVICEDFGYGCKTFPTFGIKDKEIPAKIREILSKWLPF